MKYFLQCIRVLIIALWGIAAFLTIGLALSAVNIGWASALYLWGLFVAPLAVLTYVIDRATIGSISTLHLVRWIFVWILTGSAAYIMQHGSFSWLIGLAVSPSDSIAFRAFASLEILVQWGEFFVSLAFCIWMIRRTWAAILGRSRENTLASGSKR